MTDQDRTVTSYAYDADNRKTVEIDGYGTALAGTTTTTYDKVGKHSP